MKIKKIYSFLIQPNKKETTSEQISSAEIPLFGPMFDLLSKNFDRSSQECNIAISFNPGDRGEQVNEVKNEIISFLKKPIIENAFLIAKRLQNVTTGRSGMGLLFVIYGAKSDGEQKVVIARFPADQGIMAQNTGTVLAVTFVEKVFMKNSHSYKSVVYQGCSYDCDFWEGNAIDRQVNSSGGLADYWIKNFLNSDFKIASKSGTKILAKALRKVLKETTSELVKKDILAATHLINNLNGQSVSINSICDKYGFSKSTKEEIAKNLPNSGLADSTFQFDKEEFYKNIKFISKELDSGAILTAPSEKFEQCFESKIINNNSKEVEFVARGKIVNQRLRSTKL